MKNKNDSYVCSDFFLVSTETEPKLPKNIYFCIGVFVSYGIQIFLIAQPAAPCFGVLFVRDSPTLGAAVYGEAHCPQRRLAVP